MEKQNGVSLMKENYIKHKNKIPWIIIACLSAYILATSNTIHISNNNGLFVIDYSYYTSIEE